MIDARVVEEQYSHGIACYTYELINNLINISNNTSFEFFILINKNSCLAKYILPKKHKIYYHENILD